MGGDFVVLGFASVLSGQYFEYPLALVIDFISLYGGFFFGFCSSFIGSISAFLMRTFQKYFDLK